MAVLYRASDLPYLPHIERATHGEISTSNVSIKTSSPSSVYGSPSD